jgi:UDP:flavonoid glycosyltransferase YjiC (YdhE family)
MPGPVGDQPFWARRLQRLGTSAATITQRRLTADRLADALRVAAFDRELHCSTEQFARRLAEEDGAGRVVATVEALLAETTR